MTQHEIEIEAIGGGKGNYYYRYNVYFQGEKIISLCFDPELDGARTLSSRGLEGRIVVKDRATGKTRSYTSTAASRFETEEGRSKSPHFRVKRVSGWRGPNG